MDEKIKQDIEKMEAVIVQLKTLGEELFADQITALQNKIDTLKAEAAAEVEKAVDGVNHINQNFVEKYGAGVARAIEIGLLVAVLYKLF